MLFSLCFTEYNCPGAGGSGLPQLREHLLLTSILLDFLKEHLWMAARPSRSCWRFFFIAVLLSMDLPGTRIFRTTICLPLRSLRRRRNIFCKLDFENFQRPPE